jgi:hypothetical protein
MTKPTWEQLTEAQKEPYYKRALFLIKNRYVSHINYEKLAQQIMEKTSSK